MRLLQSTLYREAFRQRCLLEHKSIIQRSHQPDYSVRVHCSPVRNTETTCRQKFDNPLNDKWPENYDKWPEKYASMYKETNFKITGTTGIFEGKSRHKNGHQGTICRRRDLAHNLKQWTVLLMTYYFCREVRLGSRVCQSPLRSFHNHWGTAPPPHQPGGNHINFYKIKKTEVNLSVW